MRRSVSVQAIPKAATPTLTVSGRLRATRRRTARAVVTLCGERPQHRAAFFRASDRTLTPGVKPARGTFGALFTSYRPDTIGKTGPTPSTVKLLNVHSVELRNSVELRSGVSSFTR